MPESITITDATIVKYFNENPNLDIVTMNHIFINILKNLSSNLSSTINSTTNAEILSIVKDIKGEVSKQSKDMILKMHESKKEYMEDVKTLLTNSNLTHGDKLSSLLERTTESLVMKTTNLLNEVIPKNQTIHYKQVDTTLKEFYNKISFDTKKLLENTKRDDTSLKEFMGTIDTQFNTMVSSLQQPIYSFISAVKRE